MSAYGIVNTIFRVSTRIFLPDLARQMEAEGTFQLDANPVGALEEADYVRVENNGADTTVFVFAGLDVLYAGMARFEFQKVLRAIGVKANFVYLRDCQRSGFFVRPDGEPGGSAFYEEVINRIKGELGSRHHIALGSSIGGTSAIHFGVQCGFEHIITFGAPFEFDVYTRPRRVFRSVFDIKKVFTEPMGYLEILLVTVTAGWAVRQILRRADFDEFPDFVGLYRAASPRPAISAFYGATAWPDVEQAQYLAEFPEVHLRPVPTGRHNSPAFMKKHGTFAPSIAEEIQRYMDVPAPIQEPTSDAPRPSIA